MNTFQYRGYEGSVEYDQRTHKWFGRVLLIGKLVPYVASNPETLEFEFKVAVDKYLDMLTKNFDNVRSIR